MLPALSARSNGPPMVAFECMHWFVEEKANKELAHVKISQM